MRWCRKEVESQLGSRSGFVVRRPGSAPVSCKVEEAARLPLPWMPYLQSNCCAWDGWTFMVVMKGKSNGGYGGMDAGHKHLSA